MPATPARADDLSLFELPPAFIAPLLSALRLCNTALDGLFYDVGGLTAALRSRGTLVVTDVEERSGAAPMPGPAFSPLDLGALANPEGCLLLVDPARAPFVTRFDRVDEFLAGARAAGFRPAAFTVTGVGSSALGSAAFAWNVATALGQPVLAVVPGYGLADVVNQALGGWFGFGLHNFWASLTQTTLATVAPHAACVGHRLLESTPHHATSATSAPVFETGSAASDVLHGLLRALPEVRLLVGHSKGALAIGNALRSLPAETTDQLKVITFGCPIQEDVPAGYAQFLGAFDPLGQLNAWGNRPEAVIPTQHSTNTGLPFAMPVALLTRAALDDAKRSGPDAVAARTRRPAISRPAWFDMRRRISRAEDRHEADKP